MIKITNFDFSKKEEEIKIRVIIISEFEHIYNKSGDFISTRFIRSFPGKRTVEQKVEQSKQKKIPIQDDEEEKQFEIIEEEVIEL